MNDAWKVWERAIAAEARQYGLPWERRLRGGDNQDMLDIDGPLPDGWLIGGKAIGRNVDLGDRMSSAMAQCERAMRNLEARYPGLAVSTIPVQIIKRQGKPTGQAYAVMEYRYLLALVAERRKWQANGQDDGAASRERHRLFDIYQNPPMPRMHGQRTAEWRLHALVRALIDGDGS